LNFPPTIAPQAGILKAGAAGIECPLEAKHVLALVMIDAAAAQRFTRRLAFLSGVLGLPSLAIANAVQFSVCSGTLIGSSEVKSTLTQTYQRCRGIELLCIRWSASRGSLTRESR
jgi:hypothetical protein